MIGKEMLKLKIVCILEKEKIELERRYIYKWILKNEQNLESCRYMFIDR